MFMPIRLVIPPASYTLASHVAIFIGMFISPKVAIGVSIGTAFGFFFGGFPIEIVIRAASHIVWAWPGAVYLSKIDKFALSGIKLRAFSLVIALVHGASEVLSVIVFFVAVGFPADRGLSWLLLFLGFGTIVHSLVDLEIANVIRRALQLQPTYKALAKSK
jgi:niacin transporter